MSQRVSGYARNERDCYETPAWVTKALLPHLPTVENVWEPAAGSGQMVQVLRDAGYDVCASDIAVNFLTVDTYFGDAIITNPPYNLAQQFIEHALELMEPRRGVVAMLLRTDYDHAATRQHLFKHPFAKKVVLTKRIVWFERKGAAPSFNHAWFIWDWKHEGPPVLAYGPCSLALAKET